MKHIFKYSIAVLALSFGIQSFAGCPSGTFGIQFINNVLPGQQLKVVVQDEATGSDLTPIQSVNPDGNSVTLCFAQDYANYKLMQFQSNQNLKYVLSKQTLIDHQYFMTIYATDSNFTPAAAG